MVANEIGRGGGRGKAARGLWRRWVGQGGGGGHPRVNGSIKSWRGGAQKKMERGKKQGGKVAVEAGGGEGGAGGCSFHRGGGKMLSDKRMGERGIGGVGGAAKKDLPLKSVERAKISHGKGMGDWWEQMGGVREGNPAKEVSGYSCSEGSV